MWGLGSCLCVFGFRLQGLRLGFLSLRLVVGLEAPERGAKSSWEAFRESPGRHLGFKGLGV